MSGSEPTVTSPISARAFLFGDHSVASIAGRLADGDVLQDAGTGLRAATGAARRLLDEQLAPIADSFLDVDLGATALAGWRRHDRLRAAARETRDTPGLVTIVDLASHRLETAWQPRVEVVVGRQPVAHLCFELTIACDVVGLAAVVEAGRLRRLGGGRCRVEVSFCVGGSALATRGAHFDPALAIPLGSGIPLLADEGVDPAGPLGSDPGQAGLGTATLQRG